MPPFGTCVDIKLGCGKLRTATFANYIPFSRTRFDTPFGIGVQYLHYLAAGLDAHSFNSPPKFASQLYLKRPLDGHDTSNTFNPSKWFSEASLPPSSCLLLLCALHIQDMRNVTLLLRSVDLPLLRPLPLAKSTSSIPAITRSPSKRLVHPIANAVKAARWRLAPPGTTLSGLAPVAIAYSRSTKKET